MNRRAGRRPCRWALTGSGLALLVTASASGQPPDAAREKRGAPPPPPERGGVYYLEDRHYGDDLIDYDSEPPYDYYERHWRREARDYRRSRDRFHRRYRDDYRGRYRPGRRYHDGGWYDDYGYGGAVFDEAYWEGRRDGRRYAEWQRRYELGRRAYADAMSDGLLAFRNADYPQAVRNFIRAAKVNQGDPASRIHAAHAMTAIGRYREALPALRRAFQLQPKIAYLALDIRRDYGAKANFDAHLKELAGAAREAKDDPALWLLLGYYQFFSGREGKALKSLKTADELAPGDFMTDALLDAARMISPAARQLPKAEHPPKPKRGPKPEHPGKKKAKPGHDV